MGLVEMSDCVTRVSTELASFFDFWKIVTLLKLDVSPPPHQLESQNYLQQEFFSKSACAYIKANFCE